MINEKVKRSETPHRPDFVESGARGNITLIVVLVVSLALVGGVAAYIVMQETAVSKSQPQPAAPQQPQEMATATSTSDDTAGWKICKNEKYHYEVKYPSNWKTWRNGPPEISPADCDQNLSDFLLSPDGGSTSFVAIYVKIGGFFKSIDDYFSKYPLVVKDRPVIKESEIDGEKAIWRSDGNIYVFHDDFIFIFRVGSSDESSRVLSTFKFLNDTANWKTYRNEQYGFEVKYPGYLEPTDTQSWENYKEILRAERRVQEPIESFYGSASQEKSKQVSIATDTFLISIIDRPLEGYSFSTPGGEFTLDLLKTHVTKNKVTSYLGGTGDILGAADLAFIGTLDKKQIIQLSIWTNATHVDCITPCPNLIPLKDEQTTYRILDTFKFIDDTAGWKTYRNEKFEFRYPSKWHLSGYYDKPNREPQYEEQFNIVPIYAGMGEGCMRGRTNATDLAFTLESTDFISAKETPYFLRISVNLFEYEKFNTIYETFPYDFQPENISDFRRISVSELVDGVRNEPVSPHYSETSYEPTNLFGGKGIHYFSTGGAGPCDVNYQEMYEIISNGYYINILITQTNVDFEKSSYPYNQELVDQILSTFRFLE